jgi:DNA primase large subunit
LERAKSRLQSTDCSKYPFLKFPFLRKTPIPDLTIADLISSDNPLVFARAKQRVQTAIDKLEIGDRVADTIEIPSFAGALILVIATKNSWIKKRYALAEAKVAYSEMLRETNEKLIQIAHDFGWTIKEEISPIKGFFIGFTDYLRNAAHLHGSEWNLSNQAIDKGLIFLNKEKVARLLEEEVKRRVEKRLDIGEIKNLPEDIHIIANELMKQAQTIIGQETEEMPKEVTKEAFPPCIVSLIQEASQAHHLSHIGRFTLTSFLLNIGMSAEAVNEFYKTFSNYNERLTKYQIEQIAGERGSATKYTPPQCSILETHSVCKNRDNLCTRIYHPLGYYRRKQKTFPLPPVPTTGQKQS